MALFQSFFMGGFECADHINRSGHRVNLLFETAHHAKVREDYSMLAELGITTVREGICWSHVEKRPSVYDFSEVKNRIRAGKELGIQQLWDMCHFGFPDDLTPTHPRFAERFSSLCGAFAQCYMGETDSTMIVTPINEISFLAWHSGEVRGTVPFMVKSGWDIKYHLCKAAIAGIQRLRSISPSCRILLTEPLIQIHPIIGEEMTEKIIQLNAEQYQAMDIIGGRLCPELGGQASYLDILGFNYYYNNQWEDEGKSLYWPEWTHVQRPLNELLIEAYKRYSRPIVLAETGHFREGRAEWLRFVINECTHAQRNGVALKGICLYPVISRPDWDNLNDYHESGLWDIDLHSKERRLCREYSDEVLKNTLREVSL